VAGAAWAEHRSSGGAEELFRRGIEAFRAEDYAAAVSLLRLSYSMQPRPETQCNLGLAFERWGGHEAEAIEAYRQCAAEDATGRFRARALQKARDLEVDEPEATEKIPASIEWGKVEKVPGCVFFSGPSGLGQSDQLGRAGKLVASGQALSLTFDGGAEFDGRRMGKLVTMSRRTTYVRSGGRWIVEESIAGMLEGGVLVAQYDYQECEEARRASCPGACSIHAALKVSLERR
jgi:hypothetical protein